MNKILLIDFCNYEDYQIGGHLSFAKNLLSAFDSELILVGITTDKFDPVGRWFRKKINGKIYDYFALARYNKTKTHHLLPDRLVCFLFLRLYRNRILSVNCKNVFVQRHEILPAIRDFHYPNICYCFPGLESPLKISKYWFGKYLAVWFDKTFFLHLRTVQLILAAGDRDAIADMEKRSKGIIKKEMVTSFPTRINTDIFKPLDKNNSRKAFGFSNDEIIVLTTGRLAWFKGWQFMIDSFIDFSKYYLNSYFYIVGEGEDYDRITDYCRQKNLTKRVILTGGKTPDQISLLLNASDLYIMGSFMEGWSTSLSEAIACGTPAVTTNFSSADSIIINGKNGFVIHDRNKILFSEAMIKAININRPVYNLNVVQYSSNYLKADLLKLWKLL